MDSWNMPTRPPFLGHRMIHWLEPLKAYQQIMILTRNTNSRLKQLLIRIMKTIEMKCFSIFFFIVFLLKRSMKQVEQKVHFLFYKQRNFSSKTNQFWGGNGPRVPISMSILKSHGSEVISNGGLPLITTCSSFNYLIKYK